jgi:hypothetical protein
VTAQARLALGSAALLAAVAALVAAAWLLAGRREEAARQARDAARPLAFSPGAVQAVVVERPGAAPFRLARGRPGWRISREGPEAEGGAVPEGPADGAAVERLLGALSTLRPRAAIPETAASLAALGLDPPRARVTLVLERGSRIVLDLGDDHPFDRTVHARVWGEGRPGARAGAAEVLLLPPGSRPSLAPDPDALRGDPPR